MRLLEFSNEENGLVDIVQEVIGSQTLYEEMRVRNEKDNVEYLLNHHVVLSIEDWLVSKQSFKSEGLPEKAKGSGITEGSDEEDIVLTIPVDNNVRRIFHYYNVKRSMSSKS